MELTVGAADEQHVRRLCTMLHSLDVLRLAPLADTDRAASPQCRCRARGEAVCKMVDRLMATTALRLGQTVLHRDHDFGLSPASATSSWPDDPSGAAVAVRGVN